MYDASILCSTEAAQKLCEVVWQLDRKKRTALITNNRKWIHMYMHCTVCLLTRDLTLFYYDKKTKQTETGWNWIWIGNAPTKLWKIYLWFLWISHLDRNCEVSHSACMLTSCGFHRRSAVRFFTSFFWSIKNGIICSFSYTCIYFTEQHLTYKFVITMHLFIFNGQFDVIFIFRL